MGTTGVMVCRLELKIITILLLFCVTSPCVPLQAQVAPQHVPPPPLISSDEIIKEGIAEIRTEQNPDVSVNALLGALEIWLNGHPLVEHATMIGSSITVRFTDGSYVILLDPFSDGSASIENTFTPCIQTCGTSLTNKTAIILNPAESMYGHRQCQRTRLLTSNMLKIIFLQRSSI